MPDLQTFSVVRNAGTTNLNVPTWTISFVITNSQTGAVITDRTGANAITFPQVLSQLTVAEQNEMVERVTRFIISRRTGIEV